MLEAYQNTFIGLWLILSTIIIQAIILIRSHRRQKTYQVGVMDSTLGQESFLFRSYRVFWNSLENIVPIFGLALLAILSGYDAYILSLVVWIYALTRIFHMFLYYTIATNKNPSIRTVFYLIGFFATLYLMIDLGIFLVYV
ncbi:MAPEG family protein [Woeseiaceae bacterium]|jgi:uncharacterized MAPEG superfamily protein|nr:MAPEG family protein [Woeseiaceae bacterium]|tara:strand:- start:502 stop:924 length:423 start_codon:yes stop_codon:yes gene_type:complete